MHTYLRYIAIVQFIQKKTQVAVSKDKSQAEREAKFFRKLLENKHKDNPKCSWPSYNCCRLFSLFINSLILPIGIFLAFTSYDLHPLSCISKGKEFIEYTRMTNATAGTVEIRFPESIKIYQIIAVVLVFILGGIFLICIICFYTSNFKIINAYEKEVEEKYTDEFGKQRQ